MKIFILCNILVIFCVASNATFDDYSDEMTSTESSKNIKNSAPTHAEHPFGRAISLLGFTADHNITVDYKTLRDLFLHPEVQNRKAVTISIIGAYRKGKSFIMDYFLRFMYAKYKSINNMQEKSQNTPWMGKPSDPLTGFSWKSGTDRHTTGIVFWSDVFLYDAPNGEQFAIFLIDTQGLFDTKTPMAQNTKIFGLGTLISSMQIFNLNDVIQEDQLQYLQMATDYARFATAENRAKGIKGVKTFQNLLFLMRDWKNVDDYGYGLDEGHRYLTDVLEIQENQIPELQEVRMYIQSSFEKVFCFLMPHPGTRVVNNNKYDGRYSEMEVDFRNELSNLVTWLFNPKSFKAKKIFNEELTAKKLHTFMKAYFEVFQMESPEIVPIYEATVQSQIKSIIDTLLVEFQNAISQNVDIHAENFLDNLDGKFTFVKDNIMERFRGERKMGTPQHEEKFKKIFSTKIDEFYKDWKDNAVRTHKAYIETLANAEIEKVNFENQLDEIIKANRTEMQNDLIELERSLKSKEVNFDEQKKLLENQKANAMEAIANDHTLSLQEIEESKKILEETFTISLQSLTMEKENKIMQLQQQLAAKKNEISLRENLQVEQEKKVEEELRRQEEKSQRDFERQQEMKLEQLKFEQASEDRRFQQEMKRMELYMAQDQRKEEFQLRLEEAKIASRTKLMEYQLNVESMREKTNSERLKLESEHSQQQMQMQLEMMKHKQESELRIAQMHAQSNAEGKSQGDQVTNVMMQQLLGMGLAALGGTTTTATGEYAPPTE